MYNKRNIISFIKPIRFLCSTRREACIVGISEVNFYISIGIQMVNKKITTEVGGLLGL